MTPQTGKGDSSSWIVESMLWLLLVGMPNLLMTDGVSSSFVVPGSCGIGVSSLIFREGKARMSSCCRIYRPCRAVLLLVTILVVCGM